MIDNFTNDVNTPTTYHRKCNIYKVSQEHVMSEEIQRTTYMYSIRQQYYKGGMCFKMVLPCANTNNYIFKSKILDPISLSMPFHFDKYSPCTCTVTWFYFKFLCVKILEANYFPLL